ncbi:hypothetical protein [Nocardiopsis gilva]|uniref:hypothetical protein n=1 Tax=Nocardiopsis gilva TaxID=280236 RepID=UPI0022B7555E|nr:hypothetical protein [Nocardiopsis gilva]
MGALVPGRTGIIVISVANRGDSAEADVVAEVDLPPGVALRASGRRGNAAPFAPSDSGWSCTATADGGKCVRSGLDAGARTTEYLDVVVSPRATAGDPPHMTVSSGDARATAAGSRGVDRGGQPARYAAAGQVRTESTGNALLTCVDDDDRWRPWPWWPIVVNKPGGEVTPAPPAAPASPSGSTASTAPEADEQRAPAAPDPVPAPASSAGPSAPAAPPPSPSTSQSPSALPSPAPTPDAPSPDDEDIDTSVDDKAEDEAEETIEEIIGESSESGECARALQREGEFRDNDMWDMRPMDLDDDPGTEMSSSARWSLPEGGAVRWAGLYFSGSGRSPASATAKLRGPGADSYIDVRADEVGRARLPGYPAYQAFADITDIVRAQGGGEWWVADVPTKTGTSTYAGWSMVVVLEDPAETYNQAMVLDASQTVFHDDQGMRFPLAGLLPAAVPATVDVVAWEGDADLPGDQVLLDGTALTPQGGDADPNNAFASSARGAVGPPLAFGTDVVRFNPVLPRDPEVRLVTRQDAYLAGAVAVTAPMRT